MAKGVNLVVLKGNLGQDPELKYIGNGNANALLSVATSTRGKKDSEGKWLDETDWHRVVIWGPDAEYLAQNAKKGDRIAVEGELRTRSWEQDGQKRYITEVIAEMAKHWPKDGGKKPPKQGQGQQAPPPMGDDDIPF